MASTSRRQIGIQTNSKYSHPKLNDSLIEAVATTINAIGLNKRRAAAMVGVDEHTLHNWLNTAADQLEAGIAPDSTLEMRLASGMAKAAADFQARTLSTIHRQGQTNWQANAWLLERQFPDEYALKRDPTPTVSINNLNVTTYHQLLMRVEEYSGDSPIALSEAIDAPSGSD